MTAKHVKQIECFNDTDPRFKFILAGRRGGKTYLITEDIVKTIHKLPYGADIYYIGPTNTQAKEIIWESLEDRLSKTNWNFETKVSKSRFELSRRRKIYVIGAEKISRIRGHKVGKAYLDEIAFFETSLKTVWSAVRPALSDLKGGAIASTTPNGRGTDAYNFYLEVLEKKGWKYYHWTTLDNPYIDPNEIAEAKEDLDEKGFSEEYKAGWESYEGVAYYNFQETLHIFEQPPIDYGIPIHMNFDFNVNPTTLLLSQKDHNMLRYKKEYSKKNSSTEDTVHEFCDDYENYKNNMQLYIRGDAAGKSRSSNTGKSDYYYVEEILKNRGFTFTKQVRPSNPPIIDRLKYVNGWLKPYSGDPRIQVDPTCKDLIRDLSSQELNGRVPSDKNNLGHKADALGYDVYYEHIIGKQQKQRSRILS